MRQVIIYPGEDGYWVAECPTLPGCISQGRTKEEAIRNIREAIGVYISALEEDGPCFRRAPGAKAIGLKEQSPSGWSFVAP